MLQKKNCKIKYCILKKKLYTIPIYVNIKNNRFLKTS